MSSRWVARLAVTCVVALFLLVPRAVTAQTDDVQRYLTAAARLYESLEYERALEQLDRAKKLSRGVDDDIAVALYEGVIRADLGQKDESVAAFKTGLFLKSDAKLPVKVSPKVEATFEAVRADVKKELAPILAKQEAERAKKAQEAAAEAKRKADAEAAARKAEAAKLEAERKAREAEAARLAALKATDKPEKDKGVLVVALPPVGPEKPDPFKVPVVEKKRSVPVAPLVILGIGAVAGGAGAYFGFESKREVGLAHDALWQDETQSHLRSADSSATLANVLFAGAGAAALTALITFFALPSESPPPAPTGAASP